MNIKQASEQLLESIKALQPNGALQVCSVRFSDFTAFQSALKEFESTAADPRARIAELEQQREAASGTLKAVQNAAIEEAHDAGNKIAYLELELAKSKQVADSYEHGMLNLNR
jgi:hypothetical protein